MIVCVFLRPYLSWLPSDELDDAAAAEDNMRPIYKVSSHCTEDTYSLFQEDAGTVQQQPVDTFWPSLQGPWGIIVQTHETRCQQKEHYHYH